jgi:hypothetical protein
MRREAEASISCKINPDDSRPGDEQEKLLAFNRAIHDFKELPTIIDEATELIGLNEQKASSRDVPSIEISRPGRQPLHVAYISRCRIITDKFRSTLVDRLGLIHSSNKSQSESDVELIKDLVDSYISEERTICLAVISAKNDYANQNILKNCRKYDPQGS